MRKVIVIRVYQAEVEKDWESPKEEELRPISFQEFDFKTCSKRQIQLLLANLARWINDKRDQPFTK